MSSCLDKIVFVTCAFGATVLLAFPARAQTTEVEQPLPATRISAPAERGSGSQAQIGSGFVLRASLAGVANLSLTSSSSLPLAVGGLRPGLFAGGKLGRLMIGLGIDFSNATLVNGSSSTSISIVTFAPELTFAIIRSADERVEFIGDAALGLGGAIVSAPYGSSGNQFLLSYQVGPGIRYWLHPNFAVQGLAGFSGQAYFPTGGSVGSGSNISIHGIFASIALLGAF